jgi:maltooligosyltrehalose trehalohydrolase
LGSAEISNDEDGSWLVIRRGSLRVVVNLDPGELLVPLDDVPAYQVMAFGAAEIVTEGVRIAGHGVGVFAA